MEILGIGPLEFILILLLALIILGPKDMTKMGRTVGRWLYKLTTSPTYKKIVNLPSTLMREAGLEELDAVIDPGKRRVLWKANPPQQRAPIAEPETPQMDETVIPNEWISPPAPPGSRSSRYEGGAPEPPLNKPDEDLPPASPEGR
jgi:Sec-independent protein translocase protein TatA